MKGSKDWTLRLPTDSGTRSLLHFAELLMACIWLLMTVPSLTLSFMIENSVLFHVSAIIKGKHEIPESVDIESSLLYLPSKLNSRIDYIIRWHLMRPGIITRRCQGVHKLKIACVLLVQQDIK